MPIHQRAWNLGPCGRRLAARFLCGESGAIASVEYVLLGTIVAIGILTGMVEYRDAVVMEYGDVAAALLSVNQSYAVDWNGDGDTSDPGETFNDVIPASVLLDGNGISVNGAAEAE